MTFILSHSEAYTKHTAFYAGSHRVPGSLALPAGRSAVVNEGSVVGRGREYLFRRHAFAPAFMCRLAAESPRLVHAHFGTAGPAGLSIARRLRVPLIVTLHGKDATVAESVALRSHRGRERRRMRQALFAETSLFIAVSSFIRSRMLESGFPEARTVVHRNGIDTGYFVPGPPLRDRTAVFVGRLVEKKGAEYFIRALGELNRPGPGGRGIVIGEGPLRADLERQAASLQADVTFTGFVPLPEVRRWIASASVVVVPSVTAADGDSEGLPTVVLEAQASATPVVATRHSGIPEGVRDGETALLVPERDHRGLAEAIALFLTDESAVERFGRAGRAYVVSEFELTRQVAGLEAHYDRVVCGLRGVPASTA